MILRESKPGTWGQGGQGGHEVTQQPAAWGGLAVMLGLPGEPLMAPAEARKLQGGRYLAHKLVE